MSEARKFRGTDRLFQRLYRELTKFRYNEDDQTIVVSASTEVWFHEGSAIVRCQALEWINGSPNAAPAFAESDEDPTGETIRRNMVHSTAIRLGVSAHDHLIEKLQAIISESAERVP